MATSQFLSGRLVALLALSTLLGACADGGVDEVSAWIESQRAQAKPGVKPLSEPKKYTPQAYVQVGALDPYSSQNLTNALRRESTRTANNADLIASELDRRKEPLESFPLDSIVMVGSMIKAKKPVALLRVDGLLYQVSVGGYVGQNYGKIQSVTETEIVLREVVQDPGGDWIERMAKLQLQEGTK